MKKILQISALAIISLGIALVWVRQGPEPIDTEALARYALQERYDPIFALPGVHLEEYASSIEALKSSAERIAKYYDEQEAELVRTTLYPIAFLERMGELEVLRRILIEKPSVDLVYTHQRKRIETIDAYQLYVETFLVTLNEIEKSLGDRTIRFHGGYSDTEHMKRTYQLLLQNADKQKLVSIARIMCLEGDKSVCTEVNRPRVPVRDGLERSFVEQLPTEITENYALVHQMREEPFKSYAHPKQIAILSSAECFGQYQPVYYHLWWRESVDGVSMFRPDILNEVIFYDMARGKQSVWPYAKLLIEQGGGPYLFQPIATHYICPDLATDLSRIESLLFMFDAELSVLYTGDDEQLSEYVRALNTDGELFKDASYLSESRMYDYLGSIDELLSAYSANELETYLGTDVVRALEDMLLIVQNGTYGYEEIVMSVVSNNDAVPQYARSGTATSLEELFYIRSMPEALLMNFNKSITQSNFSFVKVPANSLPDFVVKYKDVKDLHMFEEWIALLQNSTEVDVSLGRQAGIEYRTNQ